ncbi:hypothetical protein L7F22_042837 [Adiantum nelumboides]|nr:hypothetical protein [Adiantum nelumboides]
MAMAMAKKQGYLFSAPIPSSEWPDKAVSILLKTYAQKFSVDRGYLRTQDWQEVASAVNAVCGHLKTLKQCRDKVDSLKRRYKIEKRKAVTGGEVSWPFFHRLDDIMNSVLKQGKMQYSSHPNASSAHASADAGGGDDVDIVDEGVEIQYLGKGEDEVGNASVHLQERGDGVGAIGNGVDGKEDMSRLNSHDILSASSDIPPYLMNGQPSRRADDDYDMSEEDNDIPNGYSYRHLHHPFHDRSFRRFKQRRHNLFWPHRRHLPQHAHHDYFLQPHVRVPSRPSTFSGGTQQSTENSSHERVKRSFSHTHKRKCDNGIDALADVVTGLSKPRSAASFSDMFDRIERAKMEILKKLRVEFARLDRRHKRSSSSRKSYRSSLSTSC